MDVRECQARMEVVRKNLPEIVQAWDEKLQAHTFTAICSDGKPHAIAYQGEVTEKLLKRIELAFLKTEWDLQYPNHASIKA